MFKIVINCSRKKVITDCCSKQRFWVSTCGVSQSCLIFIVFTFLLVLSVCWNITAKYYTCYFPFSFVFFNFSYNIVKVRLFPPVWQLISQLSCKASWINILSPGQHHLISHRLVFSQSCELRRLLQGLWKQSTIKWKIEVYSSVMPVGWFSNI